MPRPPGFERSDVLSKATEVFWQRGYGATSINDLVSATGLKPGSLYAAFGSKKALFLEVLAQYHDRFIDDVDACLDTAPTSLLAVRALFERMARDSLGEGRTRGCLAVNALLEMAQHDDDIAGDLRAHSERLRRRLHTLLGRAQSDGELAADAEPAALSVFLLNNLWGMRVLCKGTPTQAALDGIVDGVMAALAASAPPTAAQRGSMRRM